MARLGIFGGTFNPIHFGHLRVAEEAREHFRLEKVIFVPSGAPPLKNSELVPVLDRLQMAKFACSGNPFFEVSAIEADEEHPSYTVNTVEKLNALYPDDSLYFILGLDSFRELEKWWMPERLTTLINFIVVSRPGSSFRDLLLSPFLKEPDKQEKREFEVFAPANEARRSLRLKLKSGRELFLFRASGYEISSSHIRRLLREEKSIRYLLPGDVISYIIQNNLYR